MRRRCWAGASRRPGGTGIRKLVAEISAGQRLGVIADVFERSLGNHLSTEAAGPGPQIDHVVRRLDGVLVVLHHDHRITQVSQPSERVEEPLVIPLVQADARLIEDVEHPYQPRADLGGQPDSLGLAAGERGGASAQREVIETHVAKEPQPIDHFLENRSRDVRIQTSPSISGGSRDTAQRDALEEFDGALNRQVNHVSDAGAVHQYRQGSPAGAAFPCRSDTAARS